MPCILESSRRESSCYSEKESMDSSTLLPHSAYGYPWNSGDSDDESSSSGTLSSASTLEDITILDNVCNSNQVQCIVQPQRPSHLTSKYKPIPDHVWTEGLAWPHEELVVIHSDINNRNDRRIFPHSANSRLSVPYHGKDSQKNVSATISKQTPTSMNRPISSTFHKNTPRALTQRTASGCSQGSTVKLIPSHTDLKRTKTVEQSNTGSQYSTVVPQDSILKRRVEQYINQYFPDQSKKALLDRVIRGANGANDDFVKHEFTSNEDVREITNSRRCSSEKPEFRLYGHAKEPSAENRFQQNKSYKVSRVGPNVLKLTNISSTSSIPSPSEISSKQSSRKNRVTISGSSCDSKPPIPQKTSNKKEVKSQFVSGIFDQGDQEASSTAEQKHCSKYTPRTMTSAFRSSTPSRSSIIKTPVSSRAKSLSVDSKYQTESSKAVTRVGRNGPVSIIKRSTERKAHKTQSVFPPSLISSFNTVAHKLSRVNALSRELNHIRRKVKRIKGYSRLGQFYCLADAYISLLCAHLAPHILCATMGYSYIRPVAMRRLFKQIRFRSMNLLSVSSACLESLFRRHYRRSKGRRISRQHKRKLSHSSNCRAENFQITNVCNSNSTQASTIESFQNTMSRSRERSGRLPENSSYVSNLRNCRLIGLPSWEQRFMGIARSQLSPGAVCLAWRDRLVLNPMQISWLKNAARQLFTFNSMGLKTQIHN